MHRDNIKHYILVILAAVFINADANEVTPQIEQFQSYVSSYNNGEPTPGEPSFEAAFQAGLGELIKRQGLQSLSSDQLGELINTLDDALFYQASDLFKDVVEKAVFELEDRGEATPSHFSSLQQAAIVVRDFELAREIIGKAEAGFLQNVPKARVPPAHEGRGVWRLAAANDALVKQGIELSSQENSIVIIGHPGCGFSNRAVQAITADPQLHSVFSDHAHLLIPPDGRLYSEMIQQWNQEHDGFEFLLLDTKTEWPEVTSWATPTFYFYRGDELEQTLVGWPGPERLGEIKKALESIGLLQATKPELSGP